MEDAAWLGIPGPYVSGHTILSQLTFPARRGGLIYGDTESGEKHTPAAEGVSFAPEAIKAGELPSAGRARVGSPEVCRPAHLRWSGVGVHLVEGGGTGSEMLFKEPLFPLEDFILRFFQSFIICFSGCCDVQRFRHPDYQQQCVCVCVYLRIEWWRQISELCDVWQQRSLITSVHIRPITALQAVAPLRL